MFFGNIDEMPQIQLKDKNGKLRIQLYVNQRGEARLAFLDSAGNIIKSFPN